MTALHFAVDAGSEQVVEWLIDETNVDVNRQDPQGNTALHFAALCGRSNISQLLISVSFFFKSLFVAWRRGVFQENSY